MERKGAGIKKRTTFGAAMQGGQSVILPSLESSGIGKLIVSQESNESYDYSEEPSS